MPSAFSVLLLLLFCSVTFCRPDIATGGGSVDNNYAMDRVALQCLKDECTPKSLPPLDRIKHEFPRFNQLTDFTLTREMLTSVCNQSSALIDCSKAKCSLTPRVEDVFGFVRISSYICDKYMEALVEHGTCLVQSIAQLIGNIQICATGSSGSAVKEVKEEGRYRRDSWRRSSWEYDEASGQESEDEEEEQKKIKRRFRRGNSEELEVEEDPFTAVRDGLNFGSSFDGRWTCQQAVAIRDCFLSETVKLQCVTGNKGEEVAKMLADLFEEFARRALKAYRGLFPDQIAQIPDGEVCFPPRADAGAAFFWF